MHANTTLWLDRVDRYKTTVSTKSKSASVTLDDAGFSSHQIMAWSPDAFRTLGDALHEAADEFEDALAQAEQVSA